MGVAPEQEALYGPRVELPGGLQLKQLGKVAQVGGPDDADPSTWGWRVVVDSIEVDPKCDQYAPDPTRGHRVVVTMKVETSTEYDPVRDGMPYFFAWRTIGPDSVSEASRSIYSPCWAATDLPSDLRPSATYRATVGVDTANRSGQLVLSNVAAWNYPG